jgi:hypothetical protein
MTPEDITYWQDTIKMMREDRKERVEKWTKLKEKLGLGYTLGKLTKKNTIYVGRFYKILRELIATIAYRYPYIFMKAEDDPADPNSGDLIIGNQDVLEDLVNDSLSLMAAKPRVKRCIFEAAFCSRGFIKLSVMPRIGRSAMPYTPSDLVPPGFPYISFIPTARMLTDPLVSPEDFRSSRFCGEEMVISLPGLLRDERFANSEAQIRRLIDQKERGSARTEISHELFGGESAPDMMDENKKKTLEKAYQLGLYSTAYEIHDRENRMRFFFLEGLDEPIEEIPHPMFVDVPTSTTGMPEEDELTVPDPFTGRPLLKRSTSNGASQSEKIPLIEGGFQYYSLAFDIYDDFFGDGIMAYAEPMQDAIVKAATRTADLLERFKRISTGRQSEADANENFKKNLRDVEDGEILMMEDENSIRPLDWGSIPPDLNRFSDQMLRYEEEIVRSAGSANPGSATEAAIGASDAQMNRDYNQDPVEEMWTWIAKGTMNILADPRLGADINYDMITTKFGADRIKGALDMWRNHGRVNVSVAAGSMNVLYEKLQKDRALSMVNFMRQSPNADQLELDRYIIRAHGDISPEKLLRDDANVDAAKAAELENQWFMQYLTDPGVTQGEDHSTHIRLQTPDAISQYPQFQQLPQEHQQMVSQIAQTHLDAHNQAFAQAQGRGAPGAGGAQPKAGPDSLISQVQSSAQKTQDVVSKEAENLTQGGSSA